jgi:hypothetical protein
MSGTVRSLIHSQKRRTVGATFYNNILAYCSLSTVTLLADVRLELAAEEADEVARGIVSLHEMSASVFLSVGLDLEEQQYVSLVDFLDYCF